MRRLALVAAAALAFGALFGALLGAGEAQRAVTVCPTVTGTTLPPSLERPAHQGRCP